MLEDFLALSRILTGVESLDPALGRQYLDRLTSTPHEFALRQVLARFRILPDDETRPRGVADSIVADDALRTVVCQIILLWYTSAMRDNDEPSHLSLRYGSPEAYFSGLGWQIIGAHVPGLSGGYFGHWRYPPDNEPSSAA